MSKDRTKRQESEVLSDQCCKPPLKVYIYRLFLFLLLFFYLLKNCTLPKPHSVSCGGKKNPVNWNKLAIFLFGGFSYENSL